MIDRQDVLAKLLAAAAAAAEVVMRVYAESDFGVEQKGPNDPVTRADKQANALLLELLGKDFPGVPIVAEESDPSTFAGFGAAPAALFVDPVDGTRDFIAKNGEFAVMLGFAEAGVATVGVVDCPALGEVYGAAVGSGAFRITKDGRAPIRVADATDLASCRCAVSRFHRSASVNAKLAALGVKELVPTGSAGIKGVRVASGALEVYAHPSKGLVKLWDTCAPEAIVRAAGGVYTDASGRAFDYRGPVAQNEGTLAANPTLHAEALRRFATAPAAS
ncbi:MAG: 3'(2'),5'-bisphosphate nucleotidase CysQ [Labilithrix sp.]|nr:3'(2'),5'-bisphosphate nucleotidase CysQ [Labilithrix sp.]